MQCSICVVAWGLAQQAAQCTTRAAAAAAAVPPARLASSHTCRAPLQVIGLAQQASSASWWGGRQLALSSADGAVAVALLPGLINQLGDMPTKFAPGALSC
jgi:hypothetical protein